MRDARDRGRPLADSLTDAALLAALDGNDEAALRQLYARHAGLVFAVAARVVGPLAADDVVQETFVALWRKHHTFDAARGDFKSWLARIARNQALNLQRRRSGASLLSSEIEIDELPDAALPADQAHWEAHRRQVLESALAALPAPQQRALSLAFLEELPHAEVARVLGTPLGTVKTRIRLGLKRLSLLMGAALLVLAGLVWRGEKNGLRDRRALRMVTASDVVPLHLSAPTGAAHGSYRARHGVGIAVLTTSELPTVNGERYRGWARVGTTWISFGELTVGDGRSVTVLEDARLAARPDEVRVTDARAAGQPGAPVLEWTPPQTP